MEQIGDHAALMKPRVMSLLLYTALGGAVLAARGLPDILILASVLVGGALASGGASSINHGLEGELDVAMRRTRSRPVAAGRISPRHAMIFGLLLNAGAFAVILFGSNLLAAALAMSGTLIYVFVYTLWLKRSTSQNIVIGGAAGAIPPLVGTIHDYRTVHPRRGNEGASKGQHGCGDRASRQALRLGMVAGRIRVPVRSSVQRFPSASRLRDKSRNRASAYPLPRGA